MGLAATPALKTRRDYQRRVRPRAKCKLRRRARRRGRDQWQAETATIGKAKPAIALSKPITGFQFDGGGYFDGVNQTVELAEEDRRGE